MNRLIFAALVLLATSLARGESLTFAIYTLKGEERELLAADRRDYTIDDIEVVPRDQDDCKGCSQKSLALADGFRIGVYVVPDLIYRGTMVGFGMWIDREGDADNFSWVWFSHEGVQDGDMIFHRGRSGGRIRVKLEPFGKLVRVASIKFLDDIELSYEEDIKVGQPGDRSHAVVVSRGSVLTIAR